MDPPLILSLVGNALLLLLAGWLGVVVVRLRERGVAFEDRMREGREAHEAAQRRAREVFEAVAGGVLEASNRRFLDMASERLGREGADAASTLKQREAAIDSMLKPIREGLERQAAAVAEVERKRVGAYSELREQVRAVSEGQAGLRSETAKLVAALRRPEVRGRWGEVQLRRVAELAGMIPHCDFFEQAHIESEGGDGRSLRPDMIVRLPSERTIVVDVKTTLDAYLNALEADDPERQQAEMAQHVAQIEAQVKNLAGKAYQSQFSRSPDFVVLFIPGESFLHAAVSSKPGLIEDAMTRNVLIASPTTLIALLKAVALGWREERLAANAEEVQRLGRDLYARLAMLAEHMGSVGKNLERTVKAYNAFQRELDGKVFATARRFEELGVEPGDGKRRVPEEGEGGAVETSPIDTTHEAIDL